MSLDALAASLERLSAKLDESGRDTVDRADFRELLTLVMQQRDQMAEMEHRAVNTFRWGTIEKVDAEKGYEVTFGMDAEGKPLPSEWIPHPEQGGDYKTWRPGSKGQIVGFFCPNGDQRQGMMIPKGGFSDQNKPPSDKLDENVETYGKVRTTRKAESDAKTVGDQVSVTTTTDNHVTKTARATHAVEAGSVDSKVGSTKHTVDAGKVLADVGLFRATRKVILASG